MSHKASRPAPASPFPSHSCAPSHPSVDGEHRQGSPFPQISLAVRSPPRITCWTPTRPSGLRGSFSELPEHSADFLAVSPVAPFNYVDALRGAQAFVSPSSAFSGARARPNAALQMRWLHARVTGASKRRLAGVAGENTGCGAKRGGSVSWICHLPRIGSC